MPIIPLGLGLAGLVPFWALALVLVFHVPLPAPRLNVMSALAVYGAIIISFLGGIRWGLAVRTDDAGGNYAISIVPSLIAWGLVFTPDPWRLAALGIAVGGWGLVDQKLVRDGVAPPWFGRLRWILSGGAALALLVAAAGTR